MSCSRCFPRCETSGKADIIIAIAAGIFNLLNFRCLGENYKLEELILSNKYSSLFSTLSRTHYLSLALLIYIGYIKFKDFISTTSCYWYNWVNKLNGNFNNNFLRVFRKFYRFFSTHIFYYQQLKYPLIKKIFLSKMNLIFNSNLNSRFNSC